MHHISRVHETLCCVYEMRHISCARDNISWSQAPDGITSGACVHGHDIINTSCAQLITSSLNKYLDWAYMLIFVKYRCSAILCRRASSQYQLITGLRLRDSLLRNNKSWHYKDGRRCFQLGFQTVKDNC